MTQRIIQGDAQETSWQMLAITLESDQGALQPPDDEMALRLRALPLKHRPEKSKDVILRFVIQGEMKAKRQKRQPAAALSDQELDKALMQAKMPEINSSYWKGFPKQVVKRIRCSMNRKAR